MCLFYKIEVKGHWALRLHHWTFGRGIVGFVWTVGIVYDSFKMNWTIGILIKRFAANYQSKQSCVENVPSGMAKFGLCAFGYLSANQSLLYPGQTKHRLVESWVFCPSSSMWGSWARCIWWDWCSCAMRSAVPWEPGKRLQLRGLHCLYWWIPDAGRGSSQTPGAYAKKPGSSPALSGILGKHCLAL